MAPRILSASMAHIQESATLLRGGALVAMPTETVYGLAANACDGKAVARVFEAKGRPSFNPLIIHFAQTRDVWAYVEASPVAQMLAERFWPGPLTMVLPRKPGCEISDLCSAGLPSLAVRVPGHMTARQFIQEAGVPIAAPSANASGEISPTRPAHVQESLGGKVDIILADGACSVGLESTVVDCTRDDVVLLRPGAITQDNIEEALGTPILLADQVEGGKAPKSPGMLLKHYAPRLPVRLNAIDVEPGEALLAFGSTRFMGVKGGGPAADLPEGACLNLSEEGDLYEAASNLFAMMRQLDNPGYTAIAVMNIPDTGVGLAINDRLRRAAQK